MALIYDVSFDSQTRVLSLLDKAGSVISSCEVPSKDVTKPLMFTATENNSSVALKRVGGVSNTYEYKLNNGDWTSYTLTTSGVVIPLSAGDKIQWRCTKRPTTFGRYVYVQFVMTGKIEASNPVTSMVLYTLDPSSLGGYNRACYALFKDCTSLTKAPELPATTLAAECYLSMFSNCQSLTEAPVLPATTLAGFCYLTMFSNCQSLNRVRISATTTATEALYYWLEGVSATGDFYCDPNATIFPTDSASGIPSGWTRLPLSDYPN